jgi:hypothetical protein
MKTPSFFKAALPAIFILSFHYLTAANIMGQVMDTTNHQAMADLPVILDCKGVQHSYTTNENGFYYASNIPGGEYTVVVVNMGTTYKMQLSLADDETREIDFNISGTVNLTSVVVDGGVSEKPLIDKWNVEIKTLDNLDVVNTGVTKIGDIAETTGNGVVEIGGVDYVRGARAGSLSYYIDNCLVLGSPEIPLCGLGLYHIYTGYIPPKYGDTVGGVVVIETKSYFSDQR